MSTSTPPLAGGTPGGRGGGAPRQPILTAPAQGHGRLPSWGPSGVVALVVLIAALLFFTTSIAIGVLVAGGIVLAAAGLYLWSLVVEGRRLAADRGVTILVTASFGLAVLPLISVIYTVISKGAARFDWAFFTESSRNVIGAGGGAANALVGTLVITLCATIISVPVGVMAAIYMQEYGTGWLKRALTFFVDVMTGIPSIVAGLFSYALFALIFGPGIRLGIMGSIALMVLMVPIVVRSTEEMLKIVPNGLREASYALGVPKWRTITSVVLPTALAGIVTGIMVAIARIVGETAPLLITTGTFSSINWNPFSGRMEALPVFAFNEYKTPGVPPEPYLDRAWTAALTLIVLVMILNLAARLVYRRFGTEIRG
jgi:phosphate transport system permease protein